MSSINKKINQTAEMSQLNSLVLDQEDWDRLLAIMDAPIEVNMNLKRAINDYSIRIKNQFTSE